MWYVVLVVASSRQKKVHVDVLSDKAEIPNKADCWHGNGGAGEYGRHPESFLGIEQGDLKNSESHSETFLFVA